MNVGIELLLALAVCQGGGLEEEVAGEVGVTATIGQQHPLEFTLRAAAYATALPAAGNRMTTGGGEKFLIVLYTLRNPTQTDTRIPWGQWFRIAAIDEFGRAFQDAAAIRLQGGVEPAPTTLAAGAEAEYRAAIRVRAVGRITELLVERTVEQTPRLSIDVGGMVSPLDAPLADPSDATGGTARRVVPAQAGTWYAHGQLDMRVEKIERPSPVKGSRRPATQRATVVTVRVRNRDDRDYTLSYGIVISRMTDTEGQRIGPVETKLGLEGATHPRTRTLQPGEDWTVLIRFETHQDAEPDTFELWERSMRPSRRAFRYDVGASQPAAKHLAAVSSGYPVGVFDPQAALPAARGGAVHSRAPTAMGLGVGRQTTPGFGAKVVVGRPDPFEFTLRGAERATGLAEADWHAVPKRVEFLVLHFLVRNPTAVDQRFISGSPKLTVLGQEYGTQKSYSEVAAEARIAGTHEPAWTTLKPGRAVAAYLVVDISSDQYFTPEELVVEHRGDTARYDLPNIPARPASPSSRYKSPGVFHASGNLDIRFDGVVPAPPGLERLAPLANSYGTSREHLVVRVTVRNRSRVDWVMLPDWRHALNWRMYTSPGPPGGYTGKIAILDRRLEPARSWVAPGMEIPLRLVIVVVEGSKPYWFMVGGMRESSGGSPKKLSFSVRAPSPLVRKAPPIAALSGGFTRPTRYPAGVYDPAPGPRLIRATLPLPGQLPKE